LTTVTNLTNLIKSAEMANVDLKKLNEVVQSGQSFEDVLKGIVEELRAKASPDATSSTDKKVSKSNYSEAKASEGKNVQEKVINESENIAQSKSSKLIQRYHRRFEFRYHHWKIERIDRIAGINNRENWTR